MEMAEKFAVILAGGEGKRAGGDRPKQFVEIAGIPMIVRTLMSFHNYDSSIRLIVVVHPGFISDYKGLIEEYGCEIPHEVACGGRSRGESVANGLCYILRENPDICGKDGVMVAVHDAARPLIDDKTLERGFSSLTPGCGRVPVTPSVNSLRKLTKGSGLDLEECESESVDRNLFVQVQTPQFFLIKDLAAAYSISPKGERMTDINFELFTDDASIAEASGIKIQLFEGNAENIKITHPIDFFIAEAIINRGK